MRLTLKLILLAGLLACTVAPADAGPIDLLPIAGAGTETRVGPLILPIGVTAGDVAKTTVDPLVIPIGAKVADQASKVGPWVGPIGSNLPDPDCKVGPGILPIG